MTAMLPIIRMAEKASGLVCKEALDGSIAVFSQCWRYRYFLSRQWHHEKPFLMWLMLNPSTATEQANDPTVERCERRARDGGFGGVIIGNLYALRSTDPGALIDAGDPVGPENDRFLIEAVKLAGSVACGWGEYGPTARAGRSRHVLGLIHAAGHKPLCLNVNRSGQPKHPLYCAYGQALRPYEGAA